MSWAKEGNTTAEGTQEKVWNRRRGKPPLLGREVEEGQAGSGNSLCWSFMPAGLEGGAALWRLLAARSLLLL